MREQPSLFETQSFTLAGKLINIEKGVDLSTIDLNTKERKVKIEPNRFILYPTGETHPYGDKVPSLKGTDFPFILSHRKKGTKILKPMIRPFWDYPIMCLPQASEQKAGAVYAQSADWTMEEVQGFIKLFGQSATLSSQINPRK